ncbi:Respiratory arsenate reductase, Mo binding subunit (ArrA) [hydrothermal vent metagenome]|uniref:Respiratory arsenate reductase, Mo binding subunit (ArrA) n=1 Tax=hydrothermal vent metagenome TaxID=652676 RepID=A0A3B0U5K6_9ZZZZ
MKVRRRDFLKSVGAAGAGAFVFNPAISAFAKSQESVDEIKPDGWYPSTCQGCTTWCPSEIYIQGGRAVKVRGNQNSKFNPGTLCPKGHLLMQQLYDPDRVKVPMKRTNPIKGKGIDPQFVPITWEEALDTIATKMMELRANEETHKFMVLRGRYSYNRDLIYSALPKIFGSPNGISHSAICAEAEKSGRYWTEGYWGYSDYDLTNTNYLVLWGVDPFRSNRLIPSTIANWGTISKNARVVVIDPHYTAACAKGDDWLAINPGQDGALASAIAHHLLVNGLWNKDFVGDFNGTGISEFVANTDVNESDFTEIESNGVVKWWNLELKNKTTAWAAGITGIAQAKIEEIAEGMAAKAPNVSIWFGPGPVMTTRGTYTAMAIWALNGLLGSIDNVGGPVRKPSTPSTSGIADYHPYQDDIAKTGASYPKIDQRGTLRFPALKKGKSGGGVVTNNTANALLAGDPYDIKVVIGYWCNHAFSCTQPQRWEEALAALPFFAHITTNASEMSQFADIVLPAAFHGTEKWAFLKTGGNLYKEISIQQPLTAPLFDVKGDENEIPFMIAEALKAKGFSNLYDYYTTEYNDPEGGAPENSMQFAEYANKVFTKKSYAKLDKGWDELLSKGVVTNGPKTFKSLWGGNFSTETGKFEFYSETLKKALQGHAAKHATDVDTVLNECNYEALGELAFVPHYEAPYRWGDIDTYPFDFIDIKSRFNREGRSQNVRGYYEFKYLDPGDNSWEDVIKINPSDASSLGISNGDEVKVTSVTGSLTTKAKLWEGVKPGTVAKTYGGGHWAYGRFASDYANLLATGGNNNDVMPDDYDRISGSTARNGGFVGVKIEKV